MSSRKERERGGRKGMERERGVEGMRGREGIKEREEREAAQRLK